MSTTQTTPMALNLNSALPNSTSPGAPKRRFQPATGEMRDHFGLICSTAKLGACWKTAAAMPASIKRADHRQRNVPISIETAHSSWLASAPVSSAKPPG